MYAEYKRPGRHGPMSGDNFIAMVVMILILLFVLMSVGPLISAF